MRVKGLDGRTYPWNLTGKIPLGSNTRPRSSGHIRCRELLEKLFPFDSRLEEVFLPGSGGLTADFVIPTQRLLIEVHGVQHREHTPFFHETPLDFLKSRGRDQSKVRWAELNDLKFIELHDNESDREWRARLLR